VTFLWPAALLALAVLPLGLLALRAIDRRRSRKVAAFAGGRPFGAQAQDAPGSPSGAGAVATARASLATRLKRTLPSALVVAGLVVMVVALARPQGTVDVPRQEGTVILAFDISASMGATDLEPTRMDAAVAAATAFVRAQPASIIVGVVAFSDSGIAVQQPTNDQDAVIAALGRLRPQRGTSLARGIDASLAAIERAAAGPTVDYYTNRTPGPSVTPTPVPAGILAPAVIVLLSDGENTGGPDPLASVQAAADRGIRIYTVGIGSEGGATLDLDGFQVHTALDAATLRMIADGTGGTYSGATDAQTLDTIYGQIDTAFVVRPEHIELTGLFAAVSLGLLVAGAVLSLAFAGRLP
jgi:Ca-activated chloride channel family protein